MTKLTKHEKRKIEEWKRFAQKNKLSLHFFEIPKDLSNTGKLYIYSKCYTIVSYAGHIDEAIYFYVTSDPNNKKYLSEQEKDALFNNLSEFYKEQGYNSGVE